MGGAFLVASWQSRDDCPSMAKIISQNSNSPRVLPRAGHFVDTCVGVNEIYACQQPTLGERSDTTTHTQDVHPQLDLQQLRVTELVQVVGLEKERTNEGKNERTNERKNDAERTNERCRTKERTKERYVATRLRTYYTCTVRTYERGNERRNGRRKEGIRKEGWMERTNERTNERCKTKE